MGYGNETIRSGILKQQAHDNIEDVAESSDYFAHIFAMFLLVQFREPQAYPLIVQFFSALGEISLDVTGDVVTEDLGCLLASVCDGDIEPIMSLIEDVHRQVGWWHLQRAVRPHE